MTLRIQNKTNITLYSNQTNDSLEPIETTAYALLLCMGILILFYSVNCLIKNCKK